MTTPLGSPAWVRAPGITDYGSATNKANAYGQGVVNARTDVGASAIMRMADHLAACVRTSPFCVGRVLCNDSTPAAPTISSCIIMPSGKTQASYEGNAPATGFPSFARNGDGDVTGTWASSYTDAYSVPGAYAPTFAVGGADSTANQNVSAYISGGQTVRFKLWDADAGTAIADGAFFFLVL